MGWRFQDGAGFGVNGFSRNYGGNVDLSEDLMHQ